MRLLFLTCYKTGHTLAERGLESFGCVICSMFTSRFFKYSRLRHELQRYARFMQRVAFRFFMPLWSVSKCCSMLQDWHEPETECFEPSPGSLRVWRGSVQHMQGGAGVLR